MGELTIKFDVPKELEKDFKKVLEEMVEEIRTRFLLSLLAKSQLTEKEAIKLGEKIKAGIDKRHGL